MCSNPANAIIESLECYMEEIVDCFEDFVKKSLVIITLAVGAVVGMLVYLLKTINSRNSFSRGTVAVGAAGNQTPGFAIGVDGQTSRAGHGQFGSAALGYKDSRYSTRDTRDENNLYSRSSKQENFKTKSSRYEEDNETNEELRRRYEQRTKHSKYNNSFTSVRGDNDNDSRRSVSSRDSRGSRTSIISKQASKEVLPTAASYTTCGKEGVVPKTCSCSPSGLPKCFRTTLSSRGTNGECTTALPSCDEVSRDCPATNVCPQKKSRLKRLSCGHLSAGSCNSRLVIPSLPACPASNIPKRSSNSPCARPVSNRYSCCSMCCEKDQR